MKRFAAVFLIILLFTAGRASAQGPVLLIGLIPEENIFHEVEWHKLLAKYIAERTGIQIQFSILSCYGDMIDRFSTRKMDGAFFEAFTGYLASVKLGVTPFMRPMAGPRPLTAKIVIITGKDSGIKTLDQLRGKRAAFVDKASMGFVYTLYKLHIHEKDTGRFFQDYYFSGNHKASIYDVLDGRADVAVVKDRFLNQVKAKDPLVAEGIQVLSVSGEMPDDVLCLRPGLPAEIKEKLRSALEDIAKYPSGRQALAALGYTGFVQAGPSDFEPVGRLLKQAGINIRTYRYSR